MSRRKPSKASPSVEVVEIPEEEQRRLINNSGIIQKVIATSEAPSEDLPDEIFNSILLIIPFSSIYLMMDILIHYQYGKHPSVVDFAQRLLSAIPCLSVLIFSVNRYRHRRLVTAALFFGSIAVGTRLIWIVNRANWLVVIRQGPPLATLWIYTIAILDLVPGVVGLLTVTIWVWYKNMKLVF